MKRSVKKPDFLKKSKRFKRSILNKWQQKLKWSGSS